MASLPSMESVNLRRWMNGWIDGSCIAAHGHALRQMSLVVGQNEIMRMRSMILKISLVVGK